MIDEAALRTAIKRHKLMLRMCRRVGPDHPNAAAMIAACTPSIVAEYRRILAKEVGR